MTARLQGVAAAPGVATAPPWSPPAPRARGAGSPPAAELGEAVARAGAELQGLADRLAAQGRAEEGAIFAAQSLMAEDPALLDPAAAAIANGTPPDEAILAAGESAAAMLAALDDELLAARAADVRDVAARIARIIRGEEPPRLGRRSIAVAVDLPPSVTAELDPALLAGIALEAGSRTAHAAILARALGIPAVVGCAGLLAAAGGASEVAVDGGSGEVFVDPDRAESAQLQRRAEAATAARAADDALRSEPLCTADGHRVTLLANIGRPDEAERAVEAGAEGVGLFRTEFMFMGRATPPDEATQRAAYASVLRAFGDRPVVIRMIDLGGDKNLPYLPLAAEENPFLGVRALRLADAGHEALIMTQLRAILRAGEETGVAPWIMAPMVADRGDVDRLHALVAAAGGSGASRAAPRVGIMVEIPSAALVADRIASRVAFFSIGTNDLTQYALAADRTNPALAGRQDPLHPAVLRLIARVVDGGHAAGIPVAVCGEMAGDPAGAVALAGLGIDELSMDPVAFGPVKRALRAVTLGDARAAARRALDADSATEARQIIDDLIT
jgi:phosphoenolpyruvate-protein phosphotransferase